MKVDSRTSQIVGARVMSRKPRKVKAKERTLPQSSACGRGGT